MDPNENMGKKSLSLAEVLNTDPTVTPPPLSVGDKVVWLSDNGTEMGIVRWVGKLPDVNNDWMAGVCFENPVGSGTGLYNNQQLFNAPMNHASLIPIIGLIKSEDFLGDQNNDNLAPKKPLRNKKKTDFFDDKIQTQISSIQNNQIYNKVGKKDSNEKKSLKNANNYEMLLELMANQCKTGTSKSFDKKCDTKHESFEIGSMIEIEIEKVSYYGVIKWLGFINGNDQMIAGIELEEEIPNGGNGMFNGKRYFTCAPQRSLFKPISSLQKDSRFFSNNQTNLYDNYNKLNKHASSDSLDSSLNISDESKSCSLKNEVLFGSIECPRVLGDIPPLSGNSAIKNLCGKNRGIQGHHNSCYMDATLFAMFASTSTFESLLHRPPGPEDIPEYSEVQKVLKEEIINPLRKNFYVRADRVMKLRQLLEKLSSVRGLTSEEKDPEEFINLLLAEILKTEPFLKLSSGLESFLYQLFVEKDEQLVLPTVQQLFDQSFLASDIKLTEIPLCLLLQLPRYGKQFKMYNRVIPSLYLDITDVLDNSPRQCVICGQLAKFECKKCFLKFGEGLDSTAFCPACSETLHLNSSKRFNHKINKLNVPQEYLEYSRRRLLSFQRNADGKTSKYSVPIERIYMELFAILCIEKSHYVCFVKCGSDPDAPWCFFDSMADRKGEQNGYNIPEVVSFSELKWWLSEEGINYLLTIKDDKLLPEMPRRLLCDAYMCLYQSLDMNLYK